MWLWSFTWARPPNRRRPGQELWGAEYWLIRLKIVCFFLCFFFILMEILIWTVLFVLISITSSLIGIIQTLTAHGLHRIGVAAVFWRELIYKSNSEHRTFSLFSILMKRGNFFCHKSRTHLMEFLLGRLPLRSTAQKQHQAQVQKKKPLVMMKMVDILDDHRWH